jgi:adenylate cyclase
MPRPVEGDAQPRDTSVCAQQARAVPMQFLHGRRIYLFLVVLILGGATLLRIADPFFVQGLRLIAFDSYQRLAPQKFDPDLPVRVVDIDEDSLARIGQWPWPRTIMAELLQKLVAQGALVVAFDILFSEPDQTSPEVAIKRLTAEEAAILAPAIAGREGHDAVFAKALGNAPAVLATALTNRAASEPLPQKAGFAVAGDDPRPFLAPFPGATSNLKVLNDAARGLGSINWVPDRDQVIRRVPLLYRVGDRYVPSLVMEALRVVQGASTYVLKASNANGETTLGQPTGLNHVKVGDLEIPTDADSGIWLQFRPSNLAAYVPAWKVLAGENDPKDVAGRIMIVGTSAPGLMDLRATPLDAAVPGVEIHVQEIEHLLSGRDLTRPDYALAIEILVMLALGTALSFVLPRIPARSSALLGVSVIALLFVGGWVAYRYGGLLLDPSYPALALFILVGAATLYVYRLVELQRGEVRRAFSHYVAPTVVDEIIRHPERLELGGEVRELTLLFCDVRNFTSISEQLTAHELTHFINTLLTPLSDIILKHRGTIDKYMGDAIMAFWNAPLDDPDHAAHACQAAFEMAGKMGELNALWRKEAEAAGRQHKTVAIGLGLNSGNCCVGNLGSVQRFDYSAIGDDVNVASRYEGLSKTYGLTIVVGEPTVARLPDPRVLELDLIRVKGRAQPTRIFTMLDALGADRDRADRLRPIHDGMLKSYRGRDWSGAEAAIAACRDLGVAALDAFYDTYLARVATLREAPPPEDWDGAFTATTK